MYLSGICNGWQLNATAKLLAGELALGFVSVGAATRVSGGEPAAHEFDDIGGPFDTEQEAVENAIQWLHAWAELQR
jgi:hypothetical protein